MNTMKPGGGDIQGCCPFIFIVFSQHDNLSFEGGEFRSMIGVIIYRQTVLIINTLLLVWY